MHIAASCDHTIRTVKNIHIILKRKLVNKTMHDVATNDGGLIVEPIRNYAYSIKKENQKKPYI